MGRKVAVTNPYTNASALWEQGLYFIGAEFPHEYTWYAVEMPDGHTERETSSKDETE